MEFLKKYKDLGVDVDVKHGSEGVAICPFHNDTSPSLSVNVETGLWCCHAGCGGGNFTQFVALLEERRDSQVVPEDVVLRYHNALLDNPKYQKELLEKRGLGPDLIKRFKLGLGDDRVRLTIPVYVGERCVNIRQHAVFKRIIPKVVSYKPGFGKGRLYPMHVLNDSASAPIILCEGELKALLAIQLGFTAVSPTGGAQFWSDAWSSHFKDRDVVLMYDVDIAGRRGAAKVAEKLRYIAKSIKNILLPIQHPSKDFPDYVLNSGVSVDDIHKLIADAKVETFETHDSAPARSRPIEINLGQASSSEYVDKYLRIDTMATGKDLAPFVIPSKLRFRCKMGTKMCTFCPVGQAKGDLKETLDPMSKETLKLVNVTEAQQKRAILESLGIPLKCFKVDTEITEWLNIEELKLLPKIDYSADPNQEYVIRQAFYIGHGLRVNQDYAINCVAMPHPLNQYVTFLVDSAKPLSDNLCTFTVTDEIIDKLAIFQAEPGKELEKMREIADDLTAHVTKIYDRNELIYAADLVFHSPLHLRFAGDLIIKGWVEGLIVGDTRTGKSETARKLINHYRAGELVTAENTSFAGLVGGMQQNNKRWSITWGILPRNDRKTVVLDETSGMNVDDISRLSGVRSSGIAEITKIQTERTFARTRLLWLSNARSSRSLNTYGSGVDVIRELIGRPEDIARFDYALLVGSGEVAPDIINTVQLSPDAKPKYTSDLCHTLILWAWSRTAEQIHFTEAAERACRDCAKSFGNLYSTDLPLVEPAEQRIKFARVAAAIAMRLFSTQDGYSVNVNESHVLAAYELLKQWYNKPVFNYAGYSRIKFKETHLRNIEGLEKLMLEYGNNFIETVLDNNYVRAQDMQDVCGCTREAAQGIMTAFISHGAIKRKNFGYVKTPGFIQMLRRLHSTTPPQQPKQPQPEAKVEAEVPF